MRDRLEELGILAFIAAVITLLAAAVAAWIFLIGASFAGWDWWTPGLDANRQVTNVTYVQANGIDLGARYEATIENVQQTAEAPACLDRGNNLFNPDGALDAQAGPGLKVTFTVGGPYSPHTVTMAVPESKINRVNMSGMPTRVQFVYEKLVWFYDHNWDDLVDTSASGIKGKISRCMAGLNAGQVARVGLKRLILYGSAAS